MAGAYAIEAMTDDIEDAARALLDRIDAAGGTLAAIEQGLIQREIQESAYRAQQAVDTGESVVVGVNQFTGGESQPIDVLRIDPEVEPRQIARVTKVRASREQSAWRSALDSVGVAARGADNLVPFIIQAVTAGATVGEISDAMRAVFGEHTEIDA